MWRLGMSTSPIPAMIVIVGLRDVNRVRILKRGEPGAHVYSHVARLDARRQPRSWFDVSSRHGRGPGTGGARPRASSKGLRLFLRLFEYSVRWSALCVALWAARDLVILSHDRVRDGETTQSGAWTRRGHSR